MTPLFPAQRAAEEFDQVLGGTAPPAVADRYADLLETVTALRTQPEVLPRAEFVGDLRSRLMTAAETELVAAPADVRQLTPTRAPGAPAAGSGPSPPSLVIVGGTAGMAAAANGALPGEAPLPDQARRGAAPRPSPASATPARARPCSTRPAPASTRCASLQGQGSPDSALIASTVDSFRELRRRRLDQAVQRLPGRRRRRGHHHGPRPSPPSRWPPSPPCPDARADHRRGPASTPPTPSPTSTSRRACCARRAARAAPSRRPRRSPPGPARPPPTTCSPGPSPRPAPTSRRPTAARRPRSPTSRPPPRRRPARSPRSTPTRSAARRRPRSPTAARPSPAPSPRRRAGPVDPDRRGRQGPRLRA